MILDKIQLSYNVKSEKLFQRNLHRLYNGCTRLVFVIFAKLNNNSKDF